jgi:acyl dehydratase
MERVTLNSELIGMKLKEVEGSWQSKDVILYALGVGAQPEAELEYVYEAKGPKVLPTFGVIAGLNGTAGFIGQVDVNPLMILHGEQTIELLRPIPPKANVKTSSEIVAIWDKGKAAIVEVEATTSDEAGPLFINRSSLFVRGAGNFGGERGPSGGDPAPQKAPDFTITYETRPEQAALYRLSGDINPLHIDPDFAKAAGFDKPFIHGLCTYGFVGRAILHLVCDGDNERFGKFKARFADRVYPGDSITTKIWKLGEGEFYVEADTPAGTAISNGLFILRK